MRQFSVQRFALIAFVLAAAAVLALGALAWNFTQQTLRALAFVSHTHQMMSALGAAESLVFRIEANHRSYLVDLGAPFVRERDAAVGELRLQLDALALLSADNVAQQQRVAALRALMDRRIDEYRALQARLEGGGTMAALDRLAEGRDFRLRLRPRFQDMIDEERALLMQRELEEKSRTATAQRTFAALGVALVVLMVAVFWRVRADLRARQRAEVATEAERRYDRAHSRALTLFNEVHDRSGALSGTLELLAEDPVFPVSAFYAYEELGGALRLAASRAAPADIRSVLHAGDGPIGTAARTGTPIYLDALEPDGGMRIETGLATLRPAAMLFAPVLHQGRLHGVLVLATTRALGERERNFVDRLCAQLGVALHNLGQLEGLGELTEQLRASAEEVRQTNEQLERANRMKSEFVANMSHELRTPLNAVIGFSEIMLDGLSGDLTAEQKEHLADIRESGRHLLSLVNDILDLSKVEAGQMTIDLTPAAPADLSASAIAVVREKAVVRHIRLNATVAPGLERVRIDLRKVKQIVYNLLTNAVKFTPDGGSVSLNVQRVDHSGIEAARAADDTRVFAPGEARHKDWLEIQVADTGIGIAPAALQALFNPFVQIDSTLGRRFAGTGLGLTMVLRLVELHGGGLMVRSTPGKGSTFTVWLPWRDTEAEPASEEDAPVFATVADQAPVSAPIVLVIEDDPRAASLMQLQLREAGHQVEIAHNAERGLELAALLHPQAIVLDIILPAMDGWDVLLLLKEREATRHIPVVVVSITDEPRRGFALGAAQVLVKPVAQEDLLAALAAAGLVPFNAGGQVLVVDDDPKAVAIVCKQLQAAGFTPEGAYGGQQALDAVARQRPDLIVLDLMMPHVSGFEVIEALARSPGSIDIPIVVLTAKLMTAQDREALRSRVQRIIDKADFDSRGLVAEVRRATARARHAGAR